MSYFLEINMSCLDIRCPKCNILTELKLAITTEAIKRLREGKRDSFYSNEICEIIDEIGAKIIKENEELKKLYQSN